MNWSALHYYLYIYILVKNAWLLSFQIVFFSFQMRSFFVKMLAAVITNSLCLFSLNWLIIIVAMHKVVIKSSWHLKFKRLIFSFKMLHATHMEKLGFSTEKSIANPKSEILTWPLSSSKILAGYINNVNTSEYHCTILLRFTFCVKLSHN